MDLSLSYEKTFSFTNINILEQINVTFSLECVDAPDHESLTTLIKVIVKEEEHEDKYHYYCLSHTLPYTFASLVNQIQIEKNGKKYYIEQAELNSFIEGILGDYLDADSIKKLSHNILKNYYKHLFDYILKINCVLDEKDLFECNKYLLTWSLKDALNL